MDGSAKVTLWRAIKTLPPRRAAEVRRSFTNERHERKGDFFEQNVRVIVTEISESKLSLKRDSTRKKWRIGFLQLIFRYQQHSLNILIFWIKNCSSLKTHLIWSKKCFFFCWKMNSLRLLSYLFSNPLAPNNFDVQRSKVFWHEPWNPGYLTRTLYNGLLQSK